MISSPSPRQRSGGRSCSRNSVMDVTLGPVPDDLLPVHSVTSSLLRVPTDLSPTARALRALEILQARPGTTAGELAARLGVTERAARRYVGILREAGIPVESTRGPYGGYRLGRGTRLPPVVFTEAEALGLVMAVLDGQPTAADADDLVGAALDKVIRALPESVGRQAAALRRARVGRARPALGPPGSRHHQRTRRRRRGPTPGAGRLPRASPATSGRPRWTRGRSSSATGAGTCCATPTARTRSAPTGSTGSARFSRPRTRFEPPDDLDPVAALEEHLGAGWEFATRVVFDAPAGRGGAVDPAADGTARTVGGRVRARRQHEQSGDVRAGVAGERAVRLPRRGRAGTARRRREARGASRRSPGGQLMDDPGRGLQGRG